MMDAYEEYIRILREKNSKEIFGNKDINHAAAICREMLRSLTNGQKIRIRSGSFAEVYLDKISDELASALARGCNVSILTEVLPSTSQKNKLREILKKAEGLSSGALRGGLSIQQKSVDEKEIKNHFSTTGTAYRLEQVHAKFQDGGELPEITANACFNGRETASVLEKYFDMLVSGSSEVDIFSA